MGDGGRLGEAEREGFDVVESTRTRRPSGFARWATTGGSAKPNAKDST
jgi:hypothetical protein